MSNLSDLLRSAIYNTSSIERKANIKEIIYDYEGKYEIKNIKLILSCYRSDSAKYKIFKMLPIKRLEINGIDDIIKIIVGFSDNYKVNVLQYLTPKYIDILYSDDILKLFDIISDDKIQLQITEYLHYTFDDICNMTREMIDKILDKVDNEHYKPLILNLLVLYYQDSFIRNPHINRIIVQEFSNTNLSSSSNAIVPKKIDEPSAPEDTPDSDICKICMDRLIVMTIKDCGHYALCQTCAREIMLKSGGKCPICRVNIEEGFLKTYKV